MFQDEGVEELRQILANIFDSDPEEEDSHIITNTTSSPQQAGAWLTEDYQSVGASKLQGKVNKVGKPLEYSV